ncbi:MAG: NAD(P)/FAD-dependent oxidoreductase [Dehalococcoidia bacterium]|nr:NAD(P)/FAD-dependent oxidoreductase [Dehalococcoidia bacterium]MDD5493996.1 NAD(P)/FAD-dependent oxidoreductase [Dehalococcoidia bacterium]
MSKKRVVVIGGGAAGMVAAGRAAELGAQVLLLEKMQQPGNKILISGNSRCNLSNARGIEEFISMFGENGPFLYGAFHSFFRDDLLRLLDRYGVKTAQEADGRIFPASNSAADVVQALQRYMEEYGVEVITGSGVTAITAVNGCVEAVHTPDKFYPAAAVVLATGGASYPQTGSTGDGYSMAAKLGHNIVKIRPALVPLTLREKAAVKSLQGISLKGVRLTSYSCAAKEINADAAPAGDTGRGIHGRAARAPVIESRCGDIIFTGSGISGPTVLLMSLAVVDAMEHGPVSISIDLLPGQDGKQLQAALQEEFTHHGRRQISNIVRQFIPERMAGPLLETAKIMPEKAASQVSAAERSALAARLKSLTFNVSGSLPLAGAMVTAGGVSLQEIDPRTMQSRLVKGLYFCGEVMDIDADTGGYNLQAAFSTGRLAGESAAAAV